MKPVLILVLAAFLPVQSFAQPAAAAEAETHAPDSGAGAEAEIATEAANGNLAGRIFTAAEVDLDEDAA